MGKRNTKNPKNQPVVRKPVKLTDHLKRMLLLWEQSELTKADDIYEISRYYSMLVRNETNRLEYQAVPYDIERREKHKNWTHFEAVYEICGMKGWDYKLYLEAQFHRYAKMEKAKLRYPYPNMLYSVPALKYFARYSLDLKQKSAKDVPKTVKKLEVSKSLLEEIEKGIIKTAKTISYQLDSLSDSIDKASYKQVIILHNWSSFSPYYLYTVSWMTDFLRADGSKRALRVLEKFDMIDLSTKYQEHVWNCLDEIEKRLNIPENIQL